jgi:hypothetical protein
MLKAKILHPTAIGLMLENQYGWQHAARNLTDFNIIIESNQFPQYIFSCLLISRINTLAACR